VFLDILDDGPKLPNLLRYSAQQFGRS